MLQIQGTKAALREEMKIEEICTRSNVCTSPEGEVRKSPEFMK